MHTLGIGFNLAFPHLEQGYMIYNNDKTLFMCDNVIYEMNEEWYTPWMPTQKDILSKEWRMTYGKPSKRFKK